jgi:tRNA threonylcarbamoyladenosine biosynthesis protein TsaB
MNSKPILAIDTSQNVCGAAVFFDRSKYFETVINLKNSHSEKIFDIIDKTLSLAEVELKDLECIAVSAGPGSFTGLRIGMSAAKGLAMGASLPICLVPTFEALAIQLSEILPDGTDFAIANKVNVDEVYYTRFHINSNNYIFAENLKIINVSELTELTKLYPVFGSAVKKDDLYSNPRPLFVAEWCRSKGTLLKANEFDFSEPNYFKNFIVKESKK